MTFIFNLDLDTVRMNKHDKYIAQSSFLPHNAMLVLYMLLPGVCLSVSKTVQGVLSMKGKEEIYVLYRMMALPMTLSNHNHPSYPILRFASSFLQRAAMLALQALY